MQEEKKYNATNRIFVSYIVSIC